MDASGSIGIMTPEAALKLAKERSLDLVEVSSRASPPVWKLMAPPPPADVDAAAEPTPSRAEPSRRRAEELPAEGTLIRRKPRPGKAAKPLKVKEVRLTDKSEMRDVQTKANNAIKFLTKGHVVKLIALNTGLMCAETQRSKALSFVQLITEQCNELATASGSRADSSVGGRGVRGQVGMVSVTLTPKSKAETGT